MSYPLSHFSGTMWLSKERHDEIFWKKDKEETNEENTERDSFTMQEVADWLRIVATMWKEENLLQPNQQS